jgi:hypothetical protein
MQILECAMTKHEAESAAFDYQLLVVRYQLVRREVAANRTTDPFERFDLRALD